MTDAEAPEDRRAYFLDIAIAVLLGIAARATAWSAYQSSLFGGDELQAFNAATVKTSEAALTSDQASQAWTEGDSDQGRPSFRYVKAARSDNSPRSLLRGSLAGPTRRAWNGGRPPAMTSTPFVDEPQLHQHRRDAPPPSCDAGLFDEAAAANGANKGRHRRRARLHTVLLAASSSCSASPASSASSTSKPASASSAPSSSSSPR
jgi:hypothetical protein